MQLICGLDEAGRGPLAGPVSAAAVILGDDFPLEYLDDSKKLNEKRREAARIQIEQHALAWAVAWASPKEIDELNILRASLLAMRRAYLLLPINADCAIVDGLHCPELPVPTQALVKADAIEPSVMAASILAKTARDRMMLRYSWLYPEYGYERHKGYPVPAHLAAIRLHGPSPIQRMSFSIAKATQSVFDFDLEKNEAYNINR